MRTICGIILAAAVALTVVGRIDAATKTWSGAVNNYDWMDAGNYQGGLPSSGDTVALPDGASRRMHENFCANYTPIFGELWNNATQSSLKLSLFFV